MFLGDARDSLLECIYASSIFWAKGRQRRIRSTFILPAITTMYIHNLGDTLAFQAKCDKVVKKAPSFMASP